ncbi:Reverse transcriptase zinc-binding domain [Macleaya cordata]|uniref:Reverse transcriptase zinc-binding domain n=1 Tax=Macleaya cordata TaxID=56857 RepID=A0A200QXC2_MACCD|nr:Reverse transcriptase zinc-binding domain [Macleaya cordata]
MELFNQIRSSPPPLTAEADVRLWTPNTKGLFSVKSVYDYITHAQPVEFPKAFIWNKHIPLKVNFFVWTAYHNRILTIDNLKKRGFILPNCCYLCGRNEETVAHIMLHCSFTSKVWNLLLPRTGWTWVPPPSVAALSFSWSFKGPRGPGKDIWPFIPPALFWSIWLERNRRAFNNKELSSFQVSVEIKSLLKFWGSVAFADFRYDLSQLIFSWDSIFS